MGRSVVTRNSPRCKRCQLPPRWCICGGFRAVDCPLKVDVLMHHMEAFRPSSTGHLIRRVIPTAGLHLYRRERPLDPTSILQRGKSLWILHPLGEPLPDYESNSSDVSDIGSGRKVERVVPNALVGTGQLAGSNNALGTTRSTPRPADLQVLLLDGTWRQAGEMMRAVEPWGRKVALPMTGASRYWLRTQAGEGKFCTIEALLFLLAALGLAREHTELRLQFELHVYAGLCSRGAKAKAAEYLAESPLRTALPGLIHELVRHRARDTGA